MDKENTKLTASMLRRSFLSPGKVKRERNGKMGDPDYEEVGPQMTSHLRDKERPVTRCELCGCADAAVRCSVCQDRAFCLGCDETFHSHPRRSGHNRKVLASESGNVRPPLPPKSNEGHPITPPLPPPRRNKRIFQKFEMKFAENKQKMENRPLPPTPNADPEPMTLTPCVKLTRSGTASGLNFNNKSFNEVSSPSPPCPSTLPHSIMNIDNRTIAQKPPSALPPQSSNQESSPQLPPKVDTRFRSLPTRKHSLQQFPNDITRKLTPLTNTPQNENETPLVNGTQRMRSQSVSEEQWKHVMSPKNDQNSELQSNVTGHGAQNPSTHNVEAKTAPYPYPLNRGLVPSSSFCDLNSIAQQNQNFNSAQPNLQPHPHMHTGGSFQQLNLMGYNPNMWMQPGHCMTCPPHNLYPHPMAPGMMKRATSNVSMNNSSGGSDFTFHYRHPNIPYGPFGYGGYPPAYHPHMMSGYQHGSTFSIPDSVKGSNRMNSSPAPSVRSSSNHSHNPSKSKTNDLSRHSSIRKRAHSQKASECSLSYSSSFSDEDHEQFFSSKHRKSKQLKPSWQCDHCTFINQGEALYCGMCSKKNEKRQNKQENGINKRGNDRHDKNFSSLERNRKYSGSGKEVGGKSRKRSFQKEINSPNNQYMDSKSSSRGASSLHSMSQSESDLESKHIESNFSHLKISPSKSYNKLSEALRSKIIENRNKESLNKGGSRYRNRRKYETGRSMTPGRTSPLRSRKSETESTGSRLRKHASVSKDNIHDDLIPCNRLSNSNKPQNRSKYFERNWRSKSYGGVDELNNFSSLSDSVESEISSNDDLQDDIDHHILQNQDSSQSNLDSESSFEEVFERKESKNKNLHSRTHQTNKNTRKTSRSSITSNESNLKPESIPDSSEIKTGAKSKLKTKNALRNNDNEIPKRHNNKKDINNSVKKNVRDKISKLVPSSLKSKNKSKESSIPSSSNNSPNDQKRVDNDIELDYGESITSPLTLNHNNIEYIDEDSEENSHNGYKHHVENGDQVSLSSSRTLPLTQRKKLSRKDSCPSVSSSDAQFYSPPNTPEHSLARKLCKTTSLRKPIFDEVIQEDEGVTFEAPESPPDIDFDDFRTPPERESFFSSKFEEHFTNRRNPEHKNQSSSDVVIVNERRKPRPNSGGFEFVPFVDHTTSGQGKETKEQIKVQKGQGNGQNIQRKGQNVQGKGKDVQETGQISQGRVQGGQEKVQNGQNEQESPKDRRVLAIQDKKDEKLLRFSSEEIEIAESFCPADKSPVEWLEENWKGMIDSVLTLAATRCAQDKDKKNVGAVTESDARKFLILHKGNIWTAVQKCVEEKQKTSLGNTSQSNYKKEKQNFTNNAAEFSSKNQDQQDVYDITSFYGYVTAVEEDEEEEEEERENEEIIEDIEEHEKYDDEEDTEEYQEEEEEYQEDTEIHEEEEDYEAEDTYSGGGKEEDEEEYEEEIAKYELKIEDEIEEEYHEREMEEYEEDSPAEDIIQEDEIELKNMKYRKKHRRESEDELESRSNKNSPPAEDQNSTENVNELLSASDDNGENKGSPAPVNHSKASKIVGKAISKAMARESAVKGQLLRKKNSQDSSRSVSPYIEDNIIESSGTGSPHGLEYKEESETGSNYMLNHVEGVSNGSPYLEEHIDESPKSGSFHEDQIEESSEFLIYHENPSHGSESENIRVGNVSEEPTIKSKSTKIKAKIPPAVASYSGPIFIPRTEDEDPGDWRGNGDLEENEILEEDRNFDISEAIQKTENKGQVTSQEELPEKKKENREISPDISSKTQNKHTVISSAETSKLGNSSKTSNIKKKILKKREPKEKRKSPEVPLVDDELEEIGEEKTDIEDVNKNYIENSVKSDKNIKVEKNTTEKKSFENIKISSAKIDEPLTDEKSTTSKLSSASNTSSKSKTSVNIKRNLSGSVSSSSMSSNYTAQTSPLNSEEKSEDEDLDDNSMMNDLKSRSSTPPMSSTEMRELKNQIRVMKDDLQSQIDTSDEESEVNSEELNNYSDYEDLKKNKKSLKIDQKNDIPNTESKIIFKKLVAADTDEEQEKIPKIQSQSSLDNLQAIKEQEQGDSSSQEPQSHLQGDEKVGQNLQPDHSSSTKPVQRNDEEENKLNFDRTVRRLLAEEKSTSYEKAELATQLINLNFNEEDCLQAAEECSSIYTAIQFLQQYCELCAEKYPAGKMVSMLYCVHRCCITCAQNYFSVQIKTKNIRELRCPFCHEPDLDKCEDTAGEYLNNLDIVLKTILDKETHELFQRKQRDWTLMKDPNFKWCNNCSSGFIANPRAKKLICPDCKTVTCSTCSKEWEAQHVGLTCDEFARWKEENDPETHPEGVSRHLAENGITCPNCRFTYSLSKGGCMHFTCMECKFEFCSGCNQPFRQGAKCPVGPYCERLGLHSHHPRNCLFYLRDKEPEQLQLLLEEHNIEYNTEIDSESNEKKNICLVIEQKETIEGLRDDVCGRIIKEGNAGMCRTHYIEYLVEKVNNHGLDPVTIFDEADLRVCLRRNGKSVPVRRWESEKFYKDKLIKLIKEQLPLM